MNRPHPVRAAVDLAIVLAPILLMVALVPAAAIVARLDQRRTT